MKTCLASLIVFLIIFLPIKIYAFSGEVSIIFSGEELGSLEPCGCYEGQLGGISRRYSFIDSFRKQANAVFPVSLGDLPKSCGSQEEIKLEILCRAMDEMGYILHNLGEKDIEINPQILSFLSQTSKVNFLSSNVKVVAPFPIKIAPYIIKECFGAEHPFKVAFLGILSKSISNTNMLDYVSISEPVEALKPLVKQLRDKVNLIVLLSHASLEESIKIAKLFPEIGLIITGHNIEDPRGAIYVNNAAVVSSGIGGKYMGVAKYSISNKVVKRKSVEVIPLDNRYKDSEEMILLLKEYQQILLDVDLLSKTPQAPLPDGLSYAGSFACGICHRIVYEHWCKTTHGTSYNTLVNVGHQYDPECIKCHTTGYGYISGFLNFEKDENLINVGCESCHGAGSSHIRNVENTYGFTGEDNCKTCHDSEHSPKFQFKEYWEKIKHPEEILKKLPKITE
jgi:hypothetical protein